MATFQVGVFYSRFKVGLTVVVLYLALGNSWMLPLGASIHPAGSEGFHLMLLCKDFGVGEAETYSDVESSGGVSSCNPLGDVLILSLWNSMGRKWLPKSLQPYEVL